MYGFLGKRGYISGTSRGQRVRNYLLRGSKSPWPKVGGLGKKVTSGCNTVLTGVKVGVGILMLAKNVNLALLSMYISN